ncbi:MAG TPA: heme ABC transporter ATP-binding protein [Vicinamibacterales bacterium]|jgi:iron complex transport system ATP-binding protein
MVEIHDVTYRVGGRDLIAGISAGFEPGRLHLVIGPNGAGKSTLIKVLARLLRPASGRVAYAGAEIAHESEASLARRRAVLSQAVEVAFPLLVHEVVAMGRYPHFGARPSSEDAAIVDEVMDYFDVADMAERAYPTLSGGEKQRVNFARVLAQVWRPLAGRERVLFLDEPLTFLDIGHQLDFLRKIVAMLAASPDLVVIGVLHDLNLAAQFADRLLLLDGGRLMAAGTRADVLTPELIRSAFGVHPVVTTVPGTDRTHLVFE